MAAPAHANRKNYDERQLRHKKMTSDIRAEFAPKELDKPFIPVLMPKLDQNGRPVFDHSTKAELHDLCPLDLLPQAMPIRVSNNEKLTDRIARAWNTTD